MARRNSPPKGHILSYSEPTPWPSGTAPAQAFCGEGDRLVVLASFAMDTLAGDAELARITRFAAKLCDAPSAMISIVEEHRQRFIASSGVDIAETPREWSFCAHAMIEAAPTIIPDARNHPRFATSPLVTDAPHVRFYAGFPLISSEGAALGTLCVIDQHERPGGLSELQIEGMEVLAEAAKRRLESHRYASQTLTELAESARRVRVMLDSVPDIAWSAAPGGLFDQFNARWRSVTGLPNPRHVQDWRDAIHPDDFDASLEKFLGAVRAAVMFEDTIRVRTSDGTYRWMLSRAVPSTDDPDTARWFGTLTDIDDRYRLSQEREWLAGELAHRIKNIFAVVNGLITLHAREQSDVSAYSEELSRSVIALSQAQDFALRADAGDDQDLKQLLTTLTLPYGAPGSGAISIAGDSIVFGRKAATPLALVFHELATNSAKYGALSMAEGQVAIATEQTGDTVRITWSESGGPPAMAPREPGFGSRLMTMAITSQLGGQMVQDWQDQGLVTTITLPAARLAQ
jgi:PAS domain S-box-containing protein